MALQFNIRLTAEGLGTGPFDIYGNLDLVNPIANNVDKNDLILGYTVSAPNYTTFVRIQSDSFSCDNYIDIGISNAPCAIFETDSYTGNSYYAYPNYVIPNTKPKRSFNIIIYLKFVLVLVDPQVDPLVPSNRKQFEQ
jgi:hypothetical protein